MFCFSLRTAISFAAVLALGVGGDFALGLRASSAGQPPVDIVDFHDPNFGLSVNITTDNFVWVVKESTFRFIDITIGNAVDNGDLKDITIILSTIKCFNHPTNAADATGIPPCVRIHADGSSLKNVKIDVRYLQSNGTMFEGMFRGVTLEKTSLDIYGMEPVFARKNGGGGGHASVDVKFSGNSNTLVGYENTFSIRDMAGKLFNAHETAQMIRFASDAALDRLRLNIYNIFNVNPKASSRTEGNSPLGVEVLVPSSKASAITLSFFSDVALYLSASLQDAAAIATFSQNSFILITNFKNVFPFPHHGGRYGESNIVINAHFDASTLYIDKCDFVRGGAGISVGNGEKKKKSSEKKSALLGDTLRFTNGAHLNITEIQSVFSPISGGTTIDVHAAFDLNSHALVDKCVNITIIRFRDLQISHRSGVRVDLTGALTLDVPSLSFGQGQSTDDASWLKVQNCEISSAFLRNIDTTGGHIQMWRNRRGPYTHPMLDAEVEFTNISGSGTISDIEGDLHPLVELRGFSGAFELWANTFHRSDMLPVEISFVENDDGSVTVPKSLIFSQNAGLIWLVDDFSNHPNRRSALLPVVSFGCATVSTFDSTAQSASIITPNPTPCDKVSTMRRCTSDFWFYQSKNRMEYVMKDGVEPCYYEQTDAPSSL